MARQVDYYFATYSPWSYLGQKLFNDIALKHKLKVVSAPESDALAKQDLEYGKDFTFELEVEVMPELRKSWLWVEPGNFQFSGTRSLRIMKTEFAMIGF